MGGAQATGLGRSSLNAASPRCPGSLRPFAIYPIRMMSSYLVQFIPQEQLEISNKWVSTCWVSQSMGGSMRPKWDSERRLSWWTNVFSSSILNEMEKEDQQWHVSFQVLLLFPLQERASSILPSPSSVVSMVIHFHSLHRAAFYTVHMDQFNRDKFHLC